MSSRTGWAVGGGYQRVGDQAAGPQRSGNAGRQEVPRGWLQGAGFEPGGGGGAHELADAVVADGGGQGDPADGGGAVLAAGHRPADPDGLFDQRPGVRAAFGLITGQQAGPGPAGEHVREFPGQVVGVAQPGGQALADERRGEVGGVAEQEDAAGLEPGRQPGPEGVAGGADDLQAGQVARPVQGRSRAPRASGVIRPASSSPSNSRNSQRYRSPVTCMKVAARAGSQTCSTPSQVSRPSSTWMSTTSQRSVKPRSSMVIPVSSRIVLLAPSQPSTTRPVNVCSSPAMRAWTRTGAAVSGPGASSSSSPVTSAPRRNSISGCCLGPGEQQLFQVGLVEHVRLREAVLAGLVLPVELGQHAMPGIQQP